MEAEVNNQFDDNDQETSSESLVEPKSGAPQEGPMHFLRLVRVLGVWAIVAACVLFLAQGLTGAEHLTQYYYFLGFSGVLATAGAGCGFLLREPKGARTLFGTLLAVAPVQFLLMGALVYSQFGVVPDSISTYFVWSVHSGYEALWASLLGIAVLAPLLYFSFMTLAREHAKQLFAPFVILNGALVLPWREPNIVALELFALVAGLVWYHRTTLSQSAALRTFEGRVARYVLIVPIALMAIRTVSIYGISQLLAGTALAGIAVALNFALEQKNRNLVYLFPEVVLSFLVFLSASQFSECIQDVFQLNFQYGLLILGLLLSGAVALLGQGERSAAKFYSRNILVPCAACATISCIGSSVNHVVLLISTAIGAVTAVHGYERKSLFVMVAGGITFSVAFGRELILAFEALQFGPWVTIAAIGISLVVLASVLEKHWGKVRTGLAEIRK